MAGTRLFLNEAKTLNRRAEGVGTNWAMGLGAA